MMNILAQPNFSKKDFQIQFFIAFSISIFLVFLHAFNFEARCYANSNLLHDLRYSLFDQIVRQDISFFDEKENSTGVLVGGRLLQDVNVICSNYIIKILNAEQDVTIAIGGIIVAFFTMWQVAIPTTVILTILVFIYYYGNKYVNEMWDMHNKQSTQSISKAEEVLTSFRTVKSFNKENYESSKYTDILNSVENVVDKISFMKGVKDAVIDGLSNIMTALFVYYSCYLIIKKPELGYKSERFLVLVFALLFAANEIVYYLSIVDDLRKARVAAKKILLILEKEPIVDQEKDGNIENTKQFKGKIEFVNVGFKYKTNSKPTNTNENHSDSNVNNSFISDEHWAVRHLSFVVEPGQTVAIVGESGCGKTTTLQLLTRFYEIDEGQILIDGVDISTMNPQIVRSLISVVPQNPVLFSMKISENIEYSTSFSRMNESCDFNYVVQASKLGNAHDFIMEMRSGYDTIVQQKSLSGGQKQRICLSRTFLPFIDSRISKHSVILLLDEATASLDTESEQMIQNALNKFDNGKITKIIVAHRLTTV